MSKKFYTHLIEVESIILELDQLNLADHEKKHLAHLIDANLHNTILDAILSELNQEDKVKFLKHLQEQSHEKIWEHLNDKVDNIEEKIKKAASDLKEQLHKDIKEAKRKNND